MIAGVRLFLEDAHALEDRIALSAGSGGAFQIDPSGPPLAPLAERSAGRGRYRQRAKLPRPPWRPPTMGERDRLLTNTFGERSRTVAIVRVFEPGKNDELASKMHALSSASLDELRSATRAEHEPWDSDIITSLLARISRLCIVRGPLEFRGLAEHVPDCHSTTFVACENKFYGLHVDDGGRVPIASLDSAANRISVNIGEHDRYLNFLNLDVVTMMERVGRTFVTDAYVAGLSDGIGRAFLECHPDYPVVRVRVRPGEAYIAPTQNILHDGANFMAATIARHLTFSGSIAVKGA